MLGGKINSSLFDLKHLVYLDFSHNDFGVHDLASLHLQNNSLLGAIPTSLINCTSLFISNSRRW
ncbi:hypothetical protein Dsin_023421 [Dipteronia sinensis]|uniref:Uncharacterized protein n=1 Tax=Dipteronia sinensis TaxID=43782 RepID=A0AAE0E0V6_9ROSI|nr:hypothetical protein Dsin_023421 [Dipteronia sinensis]